jgi:hypothetical protein
VWHKQTHRIERTIHGLWSSKNYVMRLEYRLATFVGEERKLGNGTDERL